MPSRRNSALLVRSDSRRSRSITIKSLYSTCISTHLPSPRIPVELIDRILEIFLTQACFGSQSQRFKEIASVTLTSMAFRQIALRRFFRDLYLMTRDEWSGTFDMLNALSVDAGPRGKTKSFAWVRSLFSTTSVLAFKTIRLRSFSHLHTLFIDLAQEGLSTQHPTIVNLFSYLQPSKYSSLNSLTLSSLPRIDCLLLVFIAKKFPRLVDLYLSCTERIELHCCWACFEDSLGCTLHSPVPDDYLDALKMASAFGAALRPLRYLEHLHLGVFLSDDRLLYSHISHVMDDEPTPHMIRNWVDCEDCFDGAVASVRRRELEASLLVAQQLKALDSITWSSLVTGDTGTTQVEQHVNSDDTIDEVALDQPQGEVHDETDGEGEDVGVPKSRASIVIEEECEMKTTIWILRDRGRIRVRRAPW